MSVPARSGKKKVGSPDVALRQEFHQRMESLSVIFFISFRDGSVKEKRRVLQGPRGSDNVHQQGGGRPP